MAELAANDAADDALVATVEQATDEANRTDPLLEAGEDDDEVTKAMCNKGRRWSPERRRHGQLKNTPDLRKSFRRTRETPSTTQCLLGCDAAEGRCTA